MFAARTLFMNTATVPGAPTVGTVTATNGTTVTVAYTAPADNGGRAITKYTAVSSPGGITGTLSQAGSGTITVSGLSINTSYTFTVYATNIMGNGASSAASSSVTTFNYPDAPTIGTATVVDNVSATITFTAPAYNGGTPITSYTAVSSPGSITGTLSQAGSGTITVTGLTARTAYTFTVYATNIVGNSSSSSASNSITTYGPPDAPTITSVTPTSGTAVSVAWTASPYNGGSAITYYKVECVENTNVNYSAAPGVIPNPVSLTGLTSGTTYTFRMFAHNIYGNSAYSTSSATTTNTQYLVTTPGDYLFTPPDGVTSICVLCIGGGGGGYIDSFTASTFTGSGAGGGGGLGYKNNIAVVPGTGYPFTVGAGGVKNSVAASITSGGDSFFIDTATVKGGGGGRATGRPGGTGGTHVGTGGGNGGVGGSGQQFSYPTAGGGGGAGGYSGNGGNGQSYGPPSVASQAGSGGGGGGGGMAYYNSAPLNPSTTLLYGYCYGGMGGSTGPYGSGTNGTAGSQGQQTGGNGGAGSGSTNAKGGGGGGGMNGIDGLVRIIFGSGRAYPSTNTADQ